METTTTTTSSSSSSAFTSAFFTATASSEEKNGERMEYYEEDLLNRSWKDRARVNGKLALIVLCYALSFFTLVQIGFWLVALPSFGSKIIVPTPVTTWMELKWEHGVWWDSDTKALLTNLVLLLLFYVQHSLMTQRNLEDTWIWMHIHYVHKIDRPIYVLATALVLQVVLGFWTPVPITLWIISSSSSWGWVIPYVHIFAWMSLYGTSLMLDLPDMVGFNQVVVSSPTVTQKSPDLQLMYRTQRHMGFLPFMILLLVHPLMTLDRFMLTVSMLTYTYLAWRSPDCYEYASKMKSMKRRRLSD